MQIRTKHCKANSHLQLICFKCTLSAVLMHAHTHSHTYRYTHSSHNNAFWAKSEACKARSQQAKSTEQQCIWIYVYRYTSIYLYSMYIYVYTYGTYITVYTYIYKTNLNLTWGVGHSSVGAINNCLHLLPHIYIVIYWNKTVHAVACNFWQSHLLLKLFVLWLLFIKSILMVCKYCLTVTPSKKDQREHSNEYKAGNARHLYLCVYV